MDLDKALFDEIMLPARLELRCVRENSHVVEEESVINDS